MQSLFNIGVTVDADIRLDGEEERRWVELKSEQEGFIKHPLYADGETVSGKVAIRVREGRKLEHLGIRAQFLGLIEIAGDRNVSEFIAMGLDLMPPGELRGLQTFPFEFRKVEKKYESFFGTQAKLRYVVRVSILRKMSNDIVHERDIAVFVSQPQPRDVGVTQYDLSIASHLKLEFEWRKTCYSLTDVIVGSIKFLVVRVKISHVELGILRRETIPTSTAENLASDSQYVARFEIMNGPASRGDVIPFRMFLAGYSLTPTFKNVNKRFSVTYFLSIAIVDDDGRRYIKQEEITLYRNTEGPQKPAVLPLADLPAVVLDAPNAEANSDGQTLNVNQSHAQSRNKIDSQQVGPESRQSMTSEKQHRVNEDSKQSARSSVSPGPERMLGEDAYQSLSVPQMKSQSNSGSLARHIAEESFQNHPLEGILRPAK